MTKLNEKQTAVLVNAASRPEGHLLPLRKDIQMKGGALTAMLWALERRGLAQRMEDDDWTITEAGRAAVARTPGPSAADCGNETTPAQVATTESDTGDSGSGSGPATLLRPGTRQSQLLDLLQRDEGADIDEMVQLTGWQAHSVRAVLTGFRKRGIDVTRTKEGNGVSVYRATLPDSTGGTAG